MYVSRKLSSSSAILFTANTYTRIKEFMEVANIYFALKGHSWNCKQRCYLRQWIRFSETARDKIIGTLSKCSVNTVVDGRCDAPGFNTKYGAYTLMNAQANLKLDFHIVQVYRYVQIRSYMKKEHPQININLKFGMSLKM